MIPVILRMVDGWQLAPFGKLQSVPTDGKPVTSWNDRDEAFADVARGIRNAIGQLGVLQPPVGTTTVGQAFWNVPHPRNPFFTGREDVIAGLHERLARTGKTALAQRKFGVSSPFLPENGEIRCRFNILARKDELTPDFHAGC